MANAKATAMINMTNRQWPDRQTENRNTQRRICTAKKVGKVVARDGEWSKRWEISRDSKLPCSKMEYTFSKMFVC